MASKGYIKLYREIIENPIWDSNEPFSKRDAWIDLILMANHKESKIVIGNQELVIKKGQRFTSIRKLSERWHWSANRTLAYIRLLESMKMIYRTKMCNGTLLTLVNYGKYQGQGNTNEYTNEYTTESTHMATTEYTTESQTIMSKNDIKNDKRMKKNNFSFDSSRKWE